MTIFFLLAALLGGGPAPPALPSYHWMLGGDDTVFDPAGPDFDDPKAAMETVMTDGDYKPPVVERLTEKVAAVKRTGRRYSGDARAGAGV